MNFFTTRYSSANDLGLLLFRLVFGCALIYGHGFGKLSVIFSGHEIQFLDPIGIGPKLSFFLAAFAEGICTIFLIIGLFSRAATIILTINFLVIFWFHAFVVKDGFNVLEPRLFYLFSFIALTFTGPGRISIDHILFNKKHSRY